MKKPANNRNQSDQKVRLKHIAARLNTSVATVSMAISGKGQISEDLVEKVRAVAHEMGYVPPCKRKPKRKNPIAVVLHRYNPELDLLWGYFQPTFTAIQQTMREEGYETLVLPISQETQDNEIFCAVNTIYPDALFAFSDFSDELIENLASLDIAIVMVNGTRCYSGTYCTVSPNNLQGSIDGVQYLVEANHREIAYAEFSDNAKDDFSTAFDKCCKGFRRAMNKFDLPFPKERFLKIDHELSLRSALKSLMSQPVPPTAIFVHNDFLAQRIWLIAQSMGISIPDELSIIAHGDVLGYTHLSPCQITTMKVNTNKMGEIAAELMMEQLRSGIKEETVRGVKLKQFLVDRGSIKVL